MLFNAQNVCLSATMVTSCADQSELECVKRRSASNCRRIWSVAVLISFVKDWIY